LKQRGYNVTKVTTVGAPRVCPLDDDSTSVLARMLPRDTLRIETDTDLVCKLPPSRPRWLQLQLKSKLHSGKDENNVAEQGSHSWVEQFTNFMFAPTEQRPYIGNQLLFETSESTKISAKFISREVGPNDKTGKKKKGSQENDTFPWVDSFWLSTRFFESAKHMPGCHKIASYKHHVQSLLDTVQENQKSASSESGATIDNV
jgi:hypothetical protein